VIVPLTGPDARVGEFIVQGMELAAARDDLRLEILPRDAHGSPGTAVSRLADLATMPRVVAVGGGWWAATARTLAAAANARDVPFVSFSPLAMPDSASRGQVSNLHRATMLARAAAVFAREDLGVESAGIAARGGDASVALARAFGRAFEATGGRVAWSITADETGRLDAESAEEVDAVWIAGGVDLARQVAGLKPGAARGGYLLPEGWNIDGLDGLAAPGRAIHVVSFFAAGDTSAAAREFVDACLESGIEPTSAHAFGWDLVVAVRVAARAEGATREGILRAFRSDREFVGATGPLSLGQDVERPALSRVTGDGLRFVRRVAAGGAANDAGSRAGA
jgi:ABC-type branched-subunit amino acid transport system substrate-binding protein